jgi:putative membrane protein
MKQQLFESFTHIDDFAIYLAVSLGYLAVFVSIYLRVTPYAEIELIREGNMAASFSLSGSMLGFAVPLCAAIQHSVNLADMALWGLIAMIVQVLAYVAVKIMIPSITADIPANKGSVGFFLGSFSLAVGLLNAACMSY